MDSIALLLLALSSGYSSIWQHRRTSETAADFNLKVLALSSLFIALSAVAQLLIGDQSGDFYTLRRMLENLAYFAAIPLMATAAIAISMQKVWSKPAWGRWLLGLFAFFELLRRMQYGEQYAQFIAAIAAVALIYATIKQSQPHSRTMLLSGSALIAAGLTLFSQGTLQASLQNTALFSGCLALGLPLFLMGNRRT